MVMVLTDNAGATMDSMFRDIRREIFNGQVGAYRFGRVEPTKEWQDVKTLIDEIVSKREEHGGMSWQELRFTFADTASIKAFLMARVKTECAQMQLPRSNRAIAEVCYGLAMKGAVGTIAYNTGIPPAQINEIASYYCEFVRYLEMRHADGKLQYEDLAIHWDICHDDDYENIYLAAD